MSKVTEKEKPQISEILSEDAALEYLARVLVEAYFKQKTYERTKQSK